MNKSFQQSLTEVSDSELHAKLKALATRERGLTYEVVLHLSELSRRRLYAELGYSSPHDYAIRALRYAPASASRRVKAARVIERFPEMYQCLVLGEVSLAVLETVAESLSGSNAREILASVKGATRDEALRVLANYFPSEKKFLCDRIEPVTVAKSLDTEDAAILDLFNSDKFTSVRSDTCNFVQESSEAEELFRFAFVGSRTLKHKIERAKELVFAADGAADLETVFERALDEFLHKYCPAEREERRIVRRKQRLAKIDRDVEKNAEQAAQNAEALREVAEAVVPKMPEQDRSLRNARYIPKALRDQVLVRDGQRCTFVAPDGTRCCERKGLEIDHIAPFGLGGETVAENLRVTCRAHNQMLARKIYGDAYVDGCIAGKWPVWSYQYWEAY